MRRVEDKVALVTGGGLGLGRASATRLAGEGAKVVVTDIKSEAGEAVAAEIAAAGGEALFVPQDVSKEHEWRRAIKETLERFGRLDVLVNNAGVLLRANVEDTDLEDWQALMDVNVNGVFLGTKYGIEAMKKNGGGSIVNLSSIEGLIGDPQLAAYNASKGAVRIFTKSAALHCAKAGYGIRVNSIHPGYIWTPMVEQLAEEQGDVEETRRQLAGLHPIGRVGEPDDIAFGVLYLASDESKFVTGSELVIDGGYTAQ